MNVKLFKKKDFSLLILGEFISFLGTQFQEFAFSLYVLKEYGSAAKFASVLALAVIPQLLLGPIAGVFVDWFDRKKIVVALNFLNGIVVGIMCIVCFSIGRLPLPLIYLTVILLSITNVLFGPAVATIIPTIMKKEELIEANSMNSLVQGIGNIAAPIAAGAIMGFWGLLPILAINSLSFIMASLCEVFIAIPKNELSKGVLNLKQFNKNFVEGINFIKKEKLILSIMLCAFSLNFCLSPILNVGYTYMSKNILKVSDAIYGTMCIVIGLGMVVGPFLGGIISKKYKTLKIVSSALSFSIVIFIVMAFIISPLFLNIFSSNIIPIISLAIIMFLMVSIIMILNISSTTLFQQRTPKNMLGRVGSVLSVVCLGASPLGNILFGILFDKLSAPYVVLISSSMILVTVLIFIKLTSLISNIELAA